MTENRDDSLCSFVGRGATRLVFVCAGLAMLAGCRPREEAGDAEAKKPAVRAPALRVWVVDDEELGTAIEREWTARAGGALKLKQVTEDELLAAAEERLRADVLIYPSGMLGALASAGAIEPMSDAVTSDPIFDRRDLLAMTRLKEIMWGERRYAVSFGSPFLTVLYRKDLLAKLELQPPTTWAEYQAVAAALANREALGDLAPPSEAPWSGVIEPLGPSWAGQTLLARAATYARHRSQYSTLFEFRTMKPLIDSPSFVRALEELAQAAEASDEQSKSYTPTDARREFLAGRCGMTLTWPSRVDDQSPAEGGLDDDAAIGVIELPGGDQMYNFATDSWESRDEDDTGQVTLLGVGGRLGSVTASTRRDQEAWNFLFFLTSTQIGSEVTGVSPHTTLLRESQLGVAADWVDAALQGEPADEFADVVEAAHKRGACLSSIRIPGRDQYLAALDEAVYAVLAGDAPASDALSAAAARWDEITDSLGRDKQKKAYTRSIGLEL